MAHGFSVPIDGRWLQHVTSGAVPSTFLNEQGEPALTVGAKDFPAAADEALALYKEYASFPVDVTVRVHAHLQVAVEQMKVIVASGVLGNGPFRATIAGHVKGEDDDKSEFMNIAIAG